MSMTPSHQGCGLVTMGTHDEAVAAINALHGKHVWEGMDAPMIVKWMDTALQQRRREHHLATMRQGLAQTNAMGKSSTVAAATNRRRLRLSSTYPPPSCSLPLSQVSM